MSADADELLEHVVTLLATPHREEADSFVLHAPLELFARVALLDRVTPQQRPVALDRLSSFAAAWTEAGTPVDEPPALGAGVDPVARLVAAVEAGDLDRVDAAAVAIADRFTASEIADELTDLILPRLGAAAHGCILLAHLPRFRTAAPPATTARMMRGLLRDVARTPHWRIAWIERRPAAVDPTGDLTERLLAPESPGDPGSDFIYPTMSIVDTTGLAADLLDAPTRDLGIDQARRALLRIAAWSMLQDDPTAAPYGWSHCLTMPQATLAIAPRSSAPAQAIAIAATYVLGFRSTQGRLRLDPGWAPPAPPPYERDDFLAGGADAAAARMWHALADERPHLVRRVVTYAAIHPDAHLAKYTVACLDAAADDPEAAALFLSAASYLAGWWHAHDATVASAS